MVCLLLLVKRTNAKRMPVAVMPDNPTQMPPDSMVQSQNITIASVMLWLILSPYILHPRPYRGQLSLILSGSSQAAIHHDIVPAGAACTLPPALRLQGGIAVGIRWIVAFSTVESDTTWQV